MTKHMDVDQRVVIKKRRIDQHWTYRATDLEIGVSHTAVRKESSESPLPVDLICTARTSLRLDTCGYAQNGDVP